MLVHGLHEADKLVLTLARHPRGDVDQAVCVGGHEVDRALGQAFPRDLGAHRRPPAPGHPGIAGMGAAEHPHAQRKVLACDQGQARREVLAPRLAQSRPVLGAAAQLARALLGRGIRRRFGIGPAGGALAHADLVPLDLECHQGRHEVIHVRRARQQHAERAFAVVVPAPAPRRRLGLLPGIDPHAGRDQGLHVLAHHHQARAHEAFREAADGVEERAQVELLAGGQRVQARPHRPMGGLEHPQLGLAA